MELEKGQKAPHFEANDQNGNLVKLTDFAGKKIVLYFYPKDDTPGCTAQACDLRDNMDMLKAKGYEILGVSIDNEASHRKFIEKYTLNFTLLADTEHKMVEAYGVWKEKNMYGKKYMGTARTTFIIDENAVITDIIKKVDTKAHAKQIA